MAVKSIDGATLRKMILNGAKILDTNKSHVDSLNVFPVPDGDTGTNMSLTLSSAAKEIVSCPNNSLEQLGECISKGALRGARGNSGVITSQILKGMMLVLGKCSGSFTPGDFAEAMKSGADYAYKAVTKPQEGTILTIIRSMADAGMRMRRSQDFADFFKNVIKAGEETLKKTPDMLPALKKAGVVDAGGRGLLVVFEGFYNTVLGKNEVNLEFEDTINKSIAAQGKANNYEQFHVDLQSLDDIEFAYCTEFFIVHLKETTDDKVIDVFREKLMTIGDCVLVIGDKDLVKVHVHTNVPGEALEFALQLGEIDKIKIENMLQQNRALQKIEQENLKTFGIVSVAAGKGLGQIFKDLNVDEIVDGGQTNNPSAEDIAKAADKVLAKNVFVFPNNKNIIMAANQAKELSKRNIIVIPSTNIPQGISAVLAFDASVSAEENTESMTGALSTVACGSVTFAVKDTEMDGFELKKNDVIGVTDKTILSQGKDPNRVAKDLIEKMFRDNDEATTISLYYGYETTKEQADILSKSLEKKYPDCDVQVLEGGQPLYYYIVSLE